VLDDEDEGVDSSGSEPDYTTGGGEASDTGLLEEDDQMSMSGVETGVDGHSLRTGNAWALRDPARTSAWAAQNRATLTPGPASRTGMEMDVSNFCPVKYLFTSLD